MTFYTVFEKGVGAGVYCYRPVVASVDISKAKETIQNLVRGGVPVDRIKLVQNVPFEFKCAIKLECEDEKNDG